MDETIFDGRRLSMQTHDLVAVRVDAADRGQAFLNELSRCPPKERQQLRTLQRLGLLRYIRLSQSFRVRGLAPAVRRRRSRSVSARSRRVRSAGDRGGSKRNASAATPSPATIPKVEL
jgi:hypothetical protein